MLFYIKLLSLYTKTTFHFVDSIKEMTKIMFFFIFGKAFFNKSCIFARLLYLFMILSIILSGKDEIEIIFLISINYVGT